MSAGKGFHQIKRRLSAPGRRKSEGLVLKADRPTAVAESEFSPSRVSDSKRLRRLTTSPQRVAAAIYRNEMSFESLRGDVSAERTRKFLDSPPCNPIQMRAHARMSLQISGLADGKSMPKFRAPVRTAQAGDLLEAYPCCECERFAALLRKENVNDAIIKSAFKHRYFCAPTSTPPNLWEAWDIGSIPLSLTQ